MLKLNQVFETGTGAAIHRQLASAPIDRSINIFQDSEFLVFYLETRILDYHLALYIDYNDNDMTFPTILYCLYAP